MTNPDVTMTFTPEAMSVFVAVNKLITEALDWARSASWAPDLGVNLSAPAGQAEYRAMLLRVDEMRESWHNCVLGLISLAAGFRGLRVVKDGEHALYFQVPSSGFCGAVVFHPLYLNGKRLKVGTWSTNT